MAKIICYSKNVFYFVLLSFCIDFRYVKCDSHHVDLSAFNFRKIKSDLFQHPIQYSSKIISGSNNFINNNGSTCSSEMDEIKNGLKNSSDWALNIVKSWADIPLTISSAHSYEFGEFSQCLNIERHGKHYETQYCLGQLIIEVDSDRVASMLNPIHEKLISSEYLLPQPEKGVAINFGLCLPNTCLLGEIEYTLNELAKRQLNNTSIKLFEDTCQFTEAAAELEIIDVIAIAFFSAVLCLILLSTFYDFYTFENHKKIEVFLAFSFYTNGKKLFSVQKHNAAGMIGCINGIRALSAVWVVLFHSFMVYKSIPIHNVQTYSSFTAEYHTMMIYSARIAVDTFFVLSGVLISMSMLKTFEK